MNPNALFKQASLSDLSAGMSVALVALPLSLGLALASGTPPLSGIIASVVGGVVGIFLTGTQVGVKGPAAGLIVVTVMGMEHFTQNLGFIEAYQQMLGVYVMSGVLMILIGLLRLGKLGDFFPSAVVKGMLAAVGLIILSKQLDTGFLGKDGPYETTVEVFKNLDYYLLNMHPLVGLITLNSLVLLAFLPRIKNKIISILPPTMWVMIASIVFAFVFDFFHDRELSLLGRKFHLGEHLLIQIPENLTDGIIHPSFAAFNDFYFWILVLSCTLVSGIEGLASAKATEKLDPLRRNVDLNKDIMGAGIASIISASIGGLPAITVIVRSSVNVNHGAKSFLANAIHGIIVLLVILFARDFIENVPLAALSAILIFTGYRLASPRTFKDAYLRGTEQFMILGVTAIATLSFGLVWGIAIGIGFTLLIHNLRSGMSAKVFWNYLLKPNIKTIKEQNAILIKLKGVVNFFNILKIQKVINKLALQEQVVVEFSNARLVDFTVLEYMYQRAEQFESNGGSFELIGLDVHEASTDHPFALHIHKPHRKKLSKRQQHLENLAYENKWKFEPQLVWRNPDLKQFKFFDTRPVEYKKNIVFGKFKKLKTHWQICDVTFDEGALLATDVYHSTMQIVQLPFELPEFSLEKEALTDRVKELAGFSDIDFTDHNKFSKTFLLKGGNKTAIRKLFNAELREFMLTREVYHLECNGRSILLFKYFRLASFSNIKKMVGFSRDLMDIISRNERLKT